MKKSGAARTAAEVQAETDLSTESSSIDDSPIDDSSADDSSADDSSAPIYLEPHENTLLSDLKCLLIDVQTTNSSPKTGSLLEIAWCELTPRPLSRESSELTWELGEVESHLVRAPRGVRISRTVRELTGITRDTLKSARAPAEVARALWRCIARLERDATRGQAWVWVAHLARFERSFITPLLCAHPPESEPETSRSRRDPETRLSEITWVCTHALAQRRLPTAPRRSIAAMSGLFGGRRLTLKRATPHVEATAYIWRGLINRSIHANLLTWGDLKRDLKTPVKRQPFKPALKRELRLSAPERPGVYSLRNARGETLYVGVASDLKRRVNQHFRGRKGHDEHHLELITQVEDVSWVVTETHLEALLLENREIKRITPPYNRALTHSDSPFYIDLSSDTLTPVAPELGDGPWILGSALEALTVMSRVARGDLTQIHHRAWPSVEVEEWYSTVNALLALVSLISKEREPKALNRLNVRDWVTLATHFAEEQRVEGLKTVGAEDADPIRNVCDALQVWGALAERTGQLLISFAREARFTRRLTRFAGGELIWRADLGQGEWGWRALELGSSRPLQSVALVNAPKIKLQDSQVPDIKDQDIKDQDIKNQDIQIQVMQTQNLQDQNTPTPSHRPPLILTRLAYDEARILLRFVDRALARSERVYWRETPRDAEDARIIEIMT